MECRDLERAQWLHFVSHLLDRYSVLRVVPQAADMHIHRAVISGVGVAPHHIHQILTAVHPPGIAHQEFNKIVFLGGQVHSLPAPDGNPFLRVQGQVPSCQYASLLALNPGYNINKLQIGEVLTLSASVPYLTMTVVKQERYLDDVSYNIEYTDSADLYQGDYKVTSKGEYGKADVMAKATYVNGEETERPILSSVTLKEPVTEYRLRGTKVRPTWMPTGSFRWPTSGRISSYFGGRKSPGGIGSTNHKGIDIAVPRGTPIYAADGGTVTYSGWMSGYGYLVQIDHGNGYVTRYGHNSSLTVSVGQHVYKGQQVARAGSTGNSTGNHCHFEVRYNGVAKNPLNYLP